MNGSATRDVQIAAFESCRIEAANRKEVSIGWLDKDFDSGFECWLLLDKVYRLLLMATYAPHCSSADVKVHIADRWRLTDVKKQKKKVISVDGWEVVGKKQEAVYDDSDNEDDEFVPTPLKSQIFALDDMTDFEDADSARMKLDRELDDDDDDDYVTPMHSSSRPQKDVDIVRHIINRTVNIKVPPTLESKVLAYAKSDIMTLSKKERSKLALYWSELLNLDAAADVDRYTKDYRKAAAIEEEYKAFVDCKILRSAAAIGMTTTGAAKYNTYVFIPTLA